MTNPPFLKVFIQARMSSRRFPGKVLAPLVGAPVLAHVVNRISEGIEKTSVVVVTSDDPTDDPIEAYADRCLGVQVFRGDLTDVFNRYQAALIAHPCERFVRICADSPLVSSQLIKLMISRVRFEDDLTTNVENRTFPAGQSVEIVKSSTFIDLVGTPLTGSQREHVTQYFYANKQNYIINSVRLLDADMSHKSLVVDTIEDLRAIEEKVALRHEDVSRIYSIR